MAAYGIQKPLDLAEVLSQMTYGGLMSVARSFVDMNKPESGCERDLKTPEGMAELLFDWAEATVLEAEEIARAKSAKTAA